MAFDLIKFTDQIGEFLKNENDTFLGLFFFVATEVIAISYFMKDFFSQFMEYYFYVLGVVVFATFVTWIFNRRIEIPKNKITIGIANFNVLSLNIKDGIFGSERITLEDEIISYVNDALLLYRDKLGFAESVEVVNLPKRISVYERNAQKVCEKNKVNILIWGTVRYDSNNLVHIEPSFQFYKEPRGRFYHKFKEKIIDRHIYKIDLTNELADYDNAKLLDLIHYLIYTALLFDGVRYLNHGLFEQANKIFLKGLEKISLIENPNSNLYNLYLSFKFYEGKNLYLWGNSLFDVSEERAFEKYEGARKYFFDAERKLKGEEEILFLKNFAMFGIHMLIKENKFKEARRRLSVLKKKLKDAPELLKEEIYLAAKVKAKDVGEVVEKAKYVRDAKLYEQIGNFYYFSGDYENAEHFFKERVKLSEKQIYKPTLDEVKDYVKLLEIHLHNKELIKAQWDVKDFVVHKARNVFRESKTL